MTVEPITSDETLIRLVWDPRDIQNGVYQTAIIATKELTGRDDAWSVNRAHLLQRDYVDKLLTSQKQRNSTLISPLCAAITVPQLLAIQDTAGEPELDVRPDPTPADTILGLPANDAHALVFSRTERGKAAAKQLKKRILDQLQLNPPCSVDDAFRAAQPAV